MKRNRLPMLLVDWLESREFNYNDPQGEHYLTDDEIYSAALELQSDINDLANGDFSAWYEFPTVSEKATVKRFIERESKTHVKVPLEEWYF